MAIYHIPSTTHNALGMLHGREALHLDMVHVYLQSLSLVEEDSQKTAHQGVMVDSMDGVGGWLGDSKVWILCGTRPGLRHRAWGL